MKLVQLLLGSLVTVLGGTLAGVGAKKAIEIPTLAIRRMVILALSALSGIVVLFAGLFFVLRGVAQLAEQFQEPWIFSFAVGGVILLLGAGITFAALRRQAWVPTQPESTSAPGLPPIMNILTQVALELMADRRSPSSSAPSKAPAPRASMDETDREMRPATPRSRTNVSKGSSQDWTVH